MVQSDLVDVKYFKNGPNEKDQVPYIEITWVPTVPNCHLAMTIALSITTKLNRNLPEILNHDKYKVKILVQDGKHQTKKEIDKQVSDKERVLAAMENEHVANAIEDLIKER